MENEKILEQLKEAAKDEAFMEQLFASKDAQEFGNLLAQKNVEVNDDEVKQLYEGMKNGDEISEDDLDSVAGGMAVSTACWAIACGCAFLYGCYKSFRNKC